MVMFGNLKKQRPKLHPVESRSAWCDTRMQPDSMTHGVYNPILRVAGPTPSAPTLLPIDKHVMQPKKPRDTV